MMNAKIHDLSPLGAGLRADQALLEAERIMVQFPLRGSGQVAIRAEVMWSTAADKQGARAGLEFLPLSQCAVRALRGA